MASSSTSAAWAVVIVYGSTVSPDRLLEGFGEASPRRGKPCGGKARDADEQSLGVRARLLDDVAELAEAVRREDLDARGPRAARRSRRRARSVVERIAAEEDAVGPGPFDPPRQSSVVGGREASQRPDPATATPSLPAVRSDRLGHADPVRLPVVEDVQPRHAQPLRHQGGRGALDVVGRDHPGEVAHATGVVHLWLAGQGAGTVAREADRGGGRADRRERAATRAVEDRDEETSRSPSCTARSPRSRWWQLEYARALLRQVAGVHGLPVDPRRSGRSSRRRTDSPTLVSARPGSRAERARNGSRRVNCSGWRLLRGNCRRQVGHDEEPRRPVPCELDRRAERLLDRPGHPNLSSPMREPGSEAGLDRDPDPSLPHRHAGRSTADRNRAPRCRRPDRPARRRPRRSARPRRRLLRSRSRSGCCPTPSGIVAVTDAELRVDARHARCVAVQYPDRALARGDGDRRGSRQAGPARRSGWLLGSIRSSDRSRTRARTRR